LGADGIRSWTVSLGWIVVGLAVYFAFFHREAVRRAPKVITPYPERAVGVKPARYRVLVPVYNPENVETLVGLACQLVQPYGSYGEVVVVSIVEVPVQLDISEGLRFVSQRESVLRAAELLGNRRSVRLRTEVRVAHHTARALIRMARQESADVLILGWRGYSGTHGTVFGSVVDHVIDNAPCDLLVVKFDPELKAPFKQVLLPTAGGPSARYVARIAGALLDQDGVLTLAGVVRGDASAEVEAQARKGVAETIAEIPFDVEADRKLLRGKSVPAAVIKEAKEHNYGAILVGATKVSWFKRAMFGKIPEQIARYSRTPVILVKHHEGAKTWLNRFLGS
jgi:CIC family chloride channel protein